jgi:tryptophanyl-tRNA synthetase
MELCSPPDVHTEYLRRYTNREGKFFGEMKQRLATDIIALLEPIQQRYRQTNDDTVRDVLAAGAKIVRPIAAAVLNNMRSAMGLS